VTHAGRAAVDTTANGDADALLCVRGLTKDFVGRKSMRSRSPDVLRAVDTVSFDVRRGETFGIVGESGCGKSTLARLILRLLEPTSGTVTFDGRVITDLSADDMRLLRRRMQIVFQDPYSSLNPRMTVTDIVEEPLVIHDLGDGAQRRTRVQETLELVGLTQAQAARKPHEFSGGQRQRIAVARALVAQPELVVLDEPVASLDVSIQAQVLNLLTDLQQRLGLTYLFIVHDLAVAEHFCDRVAVLYLGAIMELAEASALFTSPQHPYSRALVSAAPIPDPVLERTRERIVLPGEVSGPIGPRTGCRFEPRCPVGHGRETCKAIEPELRELRANQRAACHYPGELPDGAAVHRGFALAPAENTGPAQP
jgi:oligopeptide/dipeptide ABC transporter ATP-binding protein